MDRPKLVFSDFDDTLTFRGALTPKFFEIVELLDKFNIPLVVVTGRSVSWGHFLLTHFPSLEYVVAEGGGVIVRRTNRGHLVDNFLVEDSELERLRTFTKKLKKKFDVELSADSYGRNSDRAIELDLLLSDLEKFRKIKTFMDKEKINFSQSSVHLNYWVGEISKYNGVVQFLKLHYPDVAQEQCVFFGDSMNDESMFRHFENSVGVSNVNLILKNLEYPPKVVLKGDDNEGPLGVYNYLSEAIK